MEAKPNEWHRRPADSEGPCSVCGFRQRFRGLHRRIIDPETETVRFIKRVKSGCGWREMCFDGELQVCTRRDALDNLDKKLRPEATDWHYKPAGTKGNCPICGCPGNRLGEHRRVEDPGAKFPRFVKRLKRGKQHVLTTIDSAPPPPKPPVRRPRVPSGPVDKTRQRIAAAVRMRLFEGKTAKQIGEALGVDAKTVEWWRNDYPALWLAAEKQLSDEIIRLVRSEVGTDSVLIDPDTYLQRARLADKWTKARGEELFPVGDEPTLCTFFRSFYLPVCLSDAATSTTRGYEGVLRKWRLVTGDPPLKQITVELLAKFRDVLTNSRGLQSCKRASSQTVKSQLRHIQTLLDKAGPPERRNRDAAGIIEKVPWIRPPRAEPRPVRVIEPETINRVYTAAVGMEKPRIDNIKPPRWWRCLLVLTFNTGLRRGTLFRLRWEWVDFEKRLIAIPGHSMKARRLHVAPLNQTVVEHLRTIQSHDRELVLAWPHNSRHFDRYWHELLDLAGIPREEHFGLHDLRKTLATTLWESNPQAAQLTLSHADSAVTRNHYVEQNRIVAAAIDALPQPTAFTQSLASPA